MDHREARNTTTAFDSLADPVQRLGALWEGSRDGLWDWNLETGQVHFSPRWSEIVGADPDRLGGGIEEWFRRVHPSELEILKRALEMHLDGLSSVVDQEFRLLHADGSWRWVVCRAVKRGHVLGGSLTDITEQKSSENEVLHEAFHDPLTGLPNRALFLDRLEQSLSRARRQRDVSLAVTYLDLDRFRTVNDSLGVHAGDAFLVEVAERLSLLLRPGDTLARLGGDKFGFLVDGVRNGREAGRHAEAIARVLRAPMDIRGHEVVPSASMGIALSNKSVVTPRAEVLLGDAITAMHRAKDRGTMQHELFDPEMNAHAKSRLELEADLRHALERDELLLHYQPIISFESGRLSSFEALIRWQHPERGLVPPDQFIPIAEENGLIVPLGRWVLQQACEQLADWQDRYPQSRSLSMAVNLSSRQFEDPGLVDQVAETIEATGIDSRALKLEMTESVVMARTRENARLLKELREIGVRLMIDDFGTGYSSLANLASFPLDTLKIDRSFVNRMEFEEEKAEIVSTITTLAHNLGLDVVAEGVETEAQLRMLRDLKCQHGQGYYFSGAVDNESASAWLSSSPAW